MEIIEYFNINSGTIKDKSIQNFCDLHKQNGEIVYQPEVISKICQQLHKKNIMSVVSSGSALGLKDNYAIVINKHDWEKNYSQKRNYFNSIVYGFEYIYNFYKEMVVPLVWKKNEKDYSAGTGFKLFGGIVTAKHCITCPKNLSIKGYSANELRNSKIYVSDNDDLDIAFIDVGREEAKGVFVDNGKVLQDVLVMGYPKIPTFTNFLTAEKATISSKAEARLTPTKGAIAAFGENYLSKAELMLITAKIRGGNSGGPIINEEGSIVGVACQKPDYSSNNGDYDDLGYGIAIPIKYVSDIIEKKSNQVEQDPSFFYDYID